MHSIQTPDGIALIAAQD